MELRWQATNMPLREVDVMDHGLPTSMVDIRLMGVPIWAHGLLSWKIGITSRVGDPGIVSRYEDSGFD